MKLIYVRRHARIITLLYTRASGSPMSSDFPAEAYNWTVGRRRRFRSAVEAPTYQSKKKKKEKEPRGARLIRSVECHLLRLYML